MMIKMYLKKNMLLVWYTQELFMTLKKLKKSKHSLQLQICTNEGVDFFLFALF